MNAQTIARRIAESAESMTINISGYNVEIDSEDYDRIMSAGKWHINTSANTRAIKNNIYFRHCIREKTPTGTRVRGILLHRFIINAPDGFLVDHIDRNSFNNKKSNLRICDTHTNAVNARMFRNNTSGARGVYKHSSSKKWRASIRNRGIVYNLGAYTDFNDAVEAYKKAERHFSYDKIRGMV